MIWAFVSAGCASKTSDADELFSEKVQPLFQANCNVQCHVPDGFNGELFLGEDYGQETIVSVPSSEAPLNLVEPGSPQDSYLWHKLNDTHLEVGGSGFPMPYGNPPLPQEDLEVIEEYILLLGD